MTARSGVLYLLHFERKHKHTQHYLGFATASLEGRLREQGAKRGSRIMYAVAAAGVPWHLVRTWQGTRNDERRLKRIKGLRYYCPACAKPRQPWRFGNVNEIPLATWGRILDRRGRNLTRGFSEPTQGGNGCASF